MASAVEQFASNFNLGAFSKAQELKQRLWFTLFALLIYRVGTHIPMPGIDPHIWDSIFSQKAGGVLGMFNMFSGGAFKRMSILALNVMPYISASIILQIVSYMHPALEEMKKEGGTAARKKLNQYTRYGTVLLAAVQAYGLAMGLEKMQSPMGSAVINPGAFFVVSTIVTIVGGTMFLMWLGEQITSRGVGNGISLIIFAGIVAGIPRAVAQTLELGRQGTISTITILAIAAMVVGVVVFIVFMERAYRRVIIQYPQRAGGNRPTKETPHMPLKLNMAGVMPPILASSLLLLPVSIIGFSNKETTAAPTGWLGRAFDTVSQYMQHGQPAYMLIYGALIVFFSFFYTAITFNPDDTADNLRKSGASLPGFRPGKATADYIDFIMSRITVIGAAYLCFVCLLPEVLISKFSLPFYFGGTSLLISVSVMMDTVAQIHAYMVPHNYGGLVKKKKLKGTRSR
jgi:preprotein translocase subunit SecY